MTWKILQRWHRRIGITAAIVVVLLCVSGILLNHTTELKLSERYVGVGWILDWYDIHPSQPPLSYRVGQTLITRVGDRLYYNDEEAAAAVTQLHGAVAFDDWIVVGVDARLLVFDGGGQLVEQLDGMDGVPSGMRELGVDDHGQIIIRAAHGDYRLDFSSIHWEEEDEIAAAWSEPVEINPALEQRLLERYRGRGLPVERVLLDLHSGRILGGWGVWLMDLFAVLFLVLAVTGIWMWLKR